MATYDINGNVISELNSTIYIEALKETYPLYDDDALLEEAISLAKAAGPATKIVWDGKPILFSGSVPHECSGFGGIDFNGSRIIMPAYDGGIILNIVPDEVETITASASEIYSDHTTNANLMDKVFVLNGGHINDGASGTCIGKRTMSGVDYDVYYMTAVKANVDGSYATGELFLTPDDGDIACGNVHSYPDITFEVCNAAVVSNSDNAMSLLIKCTRSNTHIHNFVMEGRSGVTAYHNGIMQIANCYDVWVDHISGTNPIQRVNTSGYFVNLTAVASVRVADVSVGDNISWGVIGGNQLTNVVFERCHLNRVDCHYAQFGYLVIRECVLNEVSYGIGSGVIDIDNCILTNNKTSNNDISMINLREDMVGVYAGNIIVRNTQFQRGPQSANKFRIWSDNCTWQWTGSSDAPYAPKASRFIENCTIPDGVKQLMLTGTSMSADKAMFANVRIFVRDMDFSCVDTMIDAALTDQNVDSIAIEGCRFTAPRVTDKIKNCKMTINGCDTGSNNIRVTQNTGLMVISDSDIGTVVSDQQSAALTLTGCRVNGEQSFGKFTNYAAYGNISGRGTQYTAALNGSV